VAEALHHFREALECWNEARAPFEACLARVALGWAYRAKGHEEQALMQFRTARTSFERIGARFKPQACEDAWIDQTARRLAMAPLTGGALPATSRNTFLCEGDYWSLDVIPIARPNVLDRRRVH
jgi:hypothetical protein